MFRWFSAFALLVTGLGSLSAEDNSRPLPRVWRAGVELSAKPYTSAGADGKPEGFSVELLQEVAASQNLRIEYVLLDWPKLLEEFRAGRLDIICNVADTPERRQFMQFSTTTMLMHGRMFSQRDRPSLQTIDDLRGLRIAMPHASRVDEYVRAKKWPVTPVYEYDLTASVRAVYERRADIVLATELVTYKIIRENNFKNLVATELQFPDFDYRLHFGVARDHDELLEQINEGLAALHKNGVYDQLYEKWLGELDPRPLRIRDLQPYLLPLAAVLMVVLGVLLWQRGLLRRVSAQAKAIRENEERLRLVFEGSQDGFWDWEVAAGRILRSPRWASMLGYTLEEIGPARQSFLNLIHPDDRAMLEDDFKLVLAGKDHFNLEFRMKAKSGEWKWILDRGKVISRHPVTGAPLRVTGTHSDITARKLADEQSSRLEHKMLETQKLESLGILAGGIAHDFNNLLTVILGNSTLARLEAGESSITRERLDSVVTSAQRAAGLCHQLLAYAGRASYSLERINLNEIVNETTGLLELSIGKHAKLIYQLADELPMIEADAAQLRQIVMNLVINASEAIGNKSGSIKIHTSVAMLPLNEPVEVGSFDTYSTAEAIGEHVCLRVTDDGCGMTPEVLARIFDPFFSTKFTGRGLGLAAVLGIVRAHRGTLKVQSIAGQGSTFRLFLPVATAPIAAFTKDNQMTMPAVI